jgi:hypothetical protein
MATDAALLRTVVRQKVRLIPRKAADQVSQALFVSENRVGGDKGGDSGSTKVA